MINKVKLYQSERLDLPDMLNIMDFTEQELQSWTKDVFSGLPISGTPTSYILKGFTPTGISNLTFEVVVADSVLFNSAVTSGELSGATYRGESTAANLSITLADNTINYIHAVVSRSSGEADLRVFWDKTVVNSDGTSGAEWSQVVNTVDSLSVSLYVSTSGWSTDSDKIPIIKATTAMGAITVLEDYRNLYFRLGKPGDSAFTNYLTSRVEPNPDILSDTLAFTGGDKEITSLKVWMDTVMTAIKEIKWGSGPNKWFQRASTHLDSTNDILADGGTWEWELLGILDGSGQQPVAYTALGGSYVSGPLGDENFVTDGTAVGTFTVANPTALLVGDAITIYSDAVGSDPLSGIVSNITPGATDVIEMQIQSVYFDAPATILLDGGVYHNNIDNATESPFVMEDGDLAYVTLNRSATVDVAINVVAGSAYVSDPDNLIIARRVGDTLYIGEAQLVLTDGTDGTLSVSIDPNLYTYISATGSPLAVAPDYDAIIAPAAVEYFTNNVDDLTTAAAKLDVACQGLAAAMPPVGSIVAWYNYGVGNPGTGLVEFDTDYWAYCDGSVVGAVGGPLDGQTTPDLSNRYLVGFGTDGAGDEDTAVWATGVVGAAAGHTVNLQHTHTTNIGHGHANTITATAPAHYHSKGSLSISGFSGTHSHTITAHDSDGYTARVRCADPDNTQAVTISGGGHTHPNSMFSGNVGALVGTCGDVPFGCTMGGSVTAYAGSKVSGNPDASMATTNIQPRSIRVRWLIRIK